MTTRRRALKVLGASSITMPQMSLAQRQPGGASRLGFLGATSPSGFKTRVDALRSGLRELGYVEGKNLTIEYRWAEGMYERLPQLAAELVALRVDVLVTGGTPGTRAGKQATSTIPIVMAVSGDAVANGLISSLARPGGNLTGMTYLDPELHAKRLEFLQEAVPRVGHVGVLLNPLNPQSMGTTLQSLRLAADSRGLKLSLFEARVASEIEGAFSAMAQSRVDAAAIADDGMFLANLGAIAENAAKKQLPSTGAKELAEAGGLMGYGVDFVQAYYRAAHFVDKILRGAKPGDIPVEQPPSFELVVNLKTANLLGLTFPRLLMVRANRVVR